MRQGRKWPRGTAGSGQEHLQETQPASPPVAVLQGLLIPASAAWEGRLGGGHNSELPLPSSLCQLSSCPTDAPCRALVSTFPLQQVLGGQSPRPSAFAERVRDGRFPAMTKEWGGLVQTEVAGSRTSPGGRGVPCSPVFTRKRGGGVDGRGEISAAEMQPLLPSCIARITAAGTEPLRAPVGLFY